MMKEILMLMYLLQFCNCFFGGGGKTNDSCAGCENLIKCHNKVGLCISSDLKDKNVKKHPGKSLESISQTTIKAVMTDVEIIRIHEHGLILGLELEVEWLDNRLKIWQKYEKMADEPFRLWVDEFDELEDLFWVPHLKYGKGYVLDHRKLRKMSLYNKNGTLVSQKFYLTASMKCKMDFIHFPFDHHNCTLEVKF